jgi:hypothetical protein
MRAKMTMTTIADYYRPILISKWFYLSILATTISYVALDQGIRNFAHDYALFGPAIASLDFPVLRLFFLTTKYSIFFTEIGILCWEWYAPTADPKFADVLPAGTTWNQMYMKFLDDENVTIIAGRYRRNASYLDMGFADTRGKKPQPNAQWEFLKVLAQKGGEIRYADSEAKDSYKKQKQFLSEKLKSYFRLDTDPFDPYFAEKSYKIKMTLVPPPEAPKPPMAKVDFVDFADDLREAYEEQIGLR